MSSADHSSDRASLPGVLLVIVLFGVGIGVLVGLWTAYLNRLGAAETLVLVGHLGALYIVVSAVFALPPIVVLALLGVAPTARRTAALLAAAYIVVNGATRYISIVQFISVTPHVTLVAVIDALVVVTAAAALGGWIATRRTGLGLAVALVLVVSLETFHRVHEPARELDLSAYVAQTHAPAPSGSDHPERLANTRLAIFGIDGLSWEVLLPLIERGDCPNFRELLDGAALGHLATLYYPRSPALWETVATGRAPTDHGIGDHAHLLFPGIEKSIGHFPHFPLANSLMGVNRLLVGTARFAPWDKRPSSGVDAQAARFWDVASARGETVGIYNWLNTSPATEVKGFLWGFGAVPPNRYPVDLDPDWEAPREPPAGPGSAWAEGMLPSQQAEFDHFVDLARRFDPDLLAYYTHFGDGVNHLNWKREAHDDAFFFPGLLTHDFEPGEATVIAMRFIDAILGEYRRRLPDDTTFLVVSDHGFDFRGYEHDNGPAGVVIARGPSIQPGLIEGASLYDVAPTVLHILGLPVADDMESGPLRIAAAGSPLDREPERIATHGPAARPLTSDTPASPADAREHEEYLKALGYVN